MLVTWLETVLWMCSGMIQMAHVSVNDSFVCMPVSRPTGFLQCFDTVGLVICPVKIVPEMTYYVSSGTLNPTRSLTCKQNRPYWPLHLRPNLMLSFSSYAAFSAPDTEITLEVAAASVM